MKKPSGILFLVAVLLACTVPTRSPVLGQDRPPITGTWPFHPSPESVGWDPDLLGEARAYFDSLSSAAVVVVYQGKVLLAWGDYAGEYLTHSARKSFMSAMMGIYADSGAIHLDRTLAELGIDDDPPLTEGEKQARVRDLLAARSGIYHTAAAETERMHEYKPERGTYAPDEFWAYNNWDFNALVTIFNQETGRDFYEALVNGLGTALGMEEFGLDDTQYQRQPDRSVHPAYHFQISARDAARLGQLYLNDGVWEGRQVVPRSWVEESTRAISDSGPYIPGTRYGYMWWIFPEGYGRNQGLEHVGEHEMYAALGAYGQVILVIPDTDLVFVHRVDSYNRMNVSLEEWVRLLDRILAAGPARAEAQVSRESASSPGDPTQSAFPVEAALLIDGTFDRAEGITFNGEGQLFIAANSAVWRVEPNGEATRLTDLYTNMGMAAIGDRDILVADFGPTNSFNHGPNDDGIVWRVTPEGEKTVAARGMGDPNAVLVRPNGMAFSLDGRTLYVAQIFKSIDPIVPDDRIWAIPLDGEGRPTGPPELAGRTGPGEAPDGLTMDAQGRLYVAANGGGRVYRINPESGERVLVAENVPSIASLVFGQGAFDSHTLVGTSTYPGGGKIWMIPVGVGGAPLNR